MVEQLGAVGGTDLGSLVADDRAVESKLVRPGDGAGKGPARGGDDGDPGLLDAIQGGQVTWIQVQARIEDGPVQVQRQQPVANRRCYFVFTSGFRRFGGLPPRTAVAMLRAAISDISERVRVVALAMCGARTTLWRPIRPG